MIAYRVAPLLVLLALTAGCAASVAGTPSAEGASAGAPGPTDAGEGPAVDACSLLKPAEVQALIGANDGGKGDKGAHSSCQWTNPAELSVSIDIGTAGTAPNGLPPWDPAFGQERSVGDGMRSIGPGQVEFVVATRDCNLQVVTDPGSSGDDAKALPLVALVRSRLA